MDEARHVQDRALRTLPCGARPYVPAGKTLPPTEGQVKRTETIAASRREFEGNPDLRRLTNKADHINQSLRDQGLPKLSDAELKAC